jgi:hypothetical protein
MYRKKNFYLVCLVFFSLFLWLFSQRVVSAQAVCGGYCTNDANCPVGNTCYMNRCILSVCLPSLTPVQSGPYSGVTYRQTSSRTLCTPDGCLVVACGTQCASGGVCPTGLSCNSQNICVLDYCLNNPCDDPCILPRTSGLSEQPALFAIAFGFVIAGILIYRVDLFKKIWDIFRLNGGNYIISLFDKHEWFKILQRNIKSERKTFEKGFGSS